MESQPALHPSDETLVSYRLGKLDETTAESVGKHLEQCGPCRHRVDALSSEKAAGRMRAGDTSPETKSERSRTSAKVKPSSAGNQESTATQAAPIDALPPELVNHPQYEVIRELGRGGMGVVYLARNKLMGRLEVLKVLRRERPARHKMPERFLREIQSAAKLSHPNVVAAYSAQQIGDLLVFSMEYIEGDDLAKLLRARGPLPVLNAVYFVCQAAQGLQHAYERGTIHRDIKPSNLILSRQGKKATVKILDFGLAKATSEAGFDHALTAEGQILGTPDYIAPEQTRDAQKADIRADIYSLGCTLYHLLAGSPPFRGASLYELLQAHHSAEAKALNLIRPEVPVELAGVVAKMMAKDVESRYQTPGEVVQALKPFLKPSGANDRLPDSTTVDKSEAQSTVDRKASRDSDDGEEPESVTPVARVLPARRSKTSRERPAQERSTGSRQNVGPATERRTFWLWPAVVVALFAALSGAFWAGGMFGLKNTVKDSASNRGEQVALVNGDHRDNAVGNRDAARVDAGASGKSKPSESTSVKKQIALATSITAGTQVQKNGTAEQPGQKPETSRGQPAHDSPAPQPVPGPPRPAAPEPPPDDGSKKPFVPLVGDQELSGWSQLEENGSQWIVGQKGLLTGRGSGEVGGRAVLISKRDDYANFKLKLRVFNSADDRGRRIYLRRSTIDDLTSGYAINLSRHPGEADQGPAPAIGSIGKVLVRQHDEFRDAEATRLNLPIGQWYDLEITASGNGIETVVNGTRVAHYNDPYRSYSGGEIVLSCHTDATIQVKDFEIQELPAAAAGSPEDMVAKPDESLRIAKDRWEAAVEKARSKFLGQFDFEVGRLLNVKNEAARRQLSAALKRQKDNFERRGFLSWSSRMWGPQERFLKGLSIADAALGEAFEHAIENARNRNDDKSASAISMEQQLWLAPRVIAICDFTETANPNHKLRYVLYSNHKVQFPDDRSTWAFEEEQLVITNVNSPSATGDVTAKCTIARDGATFTAVDQSGNQFNGRFVEH
jgi:serine/threonine protein kinase